MICSSKILLSDFKFPKKREEEIQKTDHLRKGRKETEKKRKKNSRSSGVTVIVFKTNEAFSPSLIITSPEIFEKFFLNNLTVLCSNVKVIDL